MPSALGAKIIRKMGRSKCRICIAMNKATFPEREGAGSLEPYLSKKEHNN